VSAKGEAPGKECDVSDEGKPEPTTWERFVALARKVVQTPKAEVDKREREWRERRKQKRR
jgi:hypothetical protein